MRAHSVTALSSVSGSALEGGSDGLLDAETPAAPPVPGVLSASASAAADQTSLDAS